MINKEDFNKVWKDSTREEILNQFYYEHCDLRQMLNIIKEVRECINHYAIENEDYSKIYNDEEKELLEILDKESK